MGKIVKEVINSNRGSECILEILIGKFLDILLDYDLSRDKNRLLFEPAITDLKGKIRKDYINIAFELISKLQSLHANGIIHGDIKPANLLEHYDKISFTDYGSSLLITNNNINIDSYTTFYRPPEVWTHSWNYKSDIWALGSTLQELKTGNITFPVKFDPWSCFESWNLSRNDPWDDLINEMLNPDPYFRLDCNELLKHSIFNNMNIQYHQVTSHTLNIVESEEQACVYSKLCGLPFIFKGSYNKLYSLEKNICSLELKKESVLKWIF